jgi:hypothetical protein
LSGQAVNGLVKQTAFGLLQDEEKAGTVPDNFSATGQVFRGMKLP